MVNELGRRAAESIAKLLEQRRAPASTSADEDRILRR